MAEDHFLPVFFFSPCAGELKIENKLRRPNERKNMVKKQIRADLNRWNENSCLNCDLRESRGQEFLFRAQIELL